MVRLNLMLLLAVLLSAFYLVHTQYESRRLYTQVDKARAEMRRLEAEHEQLVVQKQAQATSSRVQFIATRQLHMRPANPAITHYVAYSAGVPTVASGVASSTSMPSLPTGVSGEPQAPSARRDAP
jgi:cell division protein FtsL